MKTIIAFVLVTGLILVAAMSIPTAPIPLPAIHVPVLPPVVDRESGSVIYWHDTFGVKIIDRHTGSHITHAAIVLNGYVYEAVIGKGVHKVPLADYKTELAQNRIPYFIRAPKNPFTQRQLSTMTKYAEAQLGRRYMVRGFDKRETVGVFCSQLVGNTIEKSGLIKSANFHESPGSLYEKLKPFYEE